MAQVPCPGCCCCFLAWLLGQLAAALRHLAGLLVGLSPQAALPLAAPRMLRRPAAASCAAAASLPCWWWISQALAALLAPLLVLRLQMVVAGLPSMVLP